MPRAIAKSSDSPVFRFDQGGALLRKVMENAAVGMSLLGMDGRLIYANDAFEEMLDYAADECLALHARDLIHAEDDAATLQRIDRLMRGEVEEFHGECRLRLKDGSALWVLASASTLRSDASGAPLYVILQIISIERQKRAETALAYSESRWNSALEAAGQGVWDHDARTDDMFYSRTWRTMRGFEPDEYVNSDQSEWLSRVHPDDRPKIRAVVGKQDRGEAGFDTLEYRERHRDGHWIWIMSRGKPVEWGPDGEPIRTIGTDTDITRLKTIEAELAEEKQRLKVTLEAIGDGVISIDAARRITFLNPVAEAMTGWTAEAAIGRLLDEVFAIVSETSAAVPRSPVAVCLSTGEISVLDSDLALVSRDGSSRDIRSTVAPVRSPDGVIIGAVLVFQDITESRALQKELAHSASHDALTDLPNRVAFERALLTTSVLALSERREHALCFVDLDRFKAVNDSAGHAAGDALLQSVARVICRNSRTADFAARIGGDEFVLLLADCTIGNSAAVAQKIVDAIAALGFAWQGQRYDIGCSIGITMVGKTKRSVVELMTEADLACYAAKAQGRGRIAFYSETGPKVATGGR